MESSTSRSARPATPIVILRWPGRISLQTARGGPTRSRTRCAAGEVAQRCGAGHSGAPNDSRGRAPEFAAAERGGIAATENGGHRVAVAPFPVARWAGGAQRGGGDLRADSPDVPRFIRDSGRGTCANRDQARR